MEGQLDDELADRWKAGQTSVLNLHDMQLLFIMAILVGDLVMTIKGSEIPDSVVLFSLPEPKVYGI